MKVFKFGGASVKDADGVRNLLEVIRSEGQQDLFVVVSAMGKTTNALEKVVSAYFHQKEALNDALSEVEGFHHTIASDLFPHPEHPGRTVVKEHLSQLKSFLGSNKSQNHAFVYDQVVSVGELISTSLVSAYLADKGMDNKWLDVRSCILTDDYYRSARVDWSATQEAIGKQVGFKGLTITQGFLGAEKNNNFTTTLGREGSDYTAAIFAYCLNAESVTIWKDVPGVLNADPRHFSETRLLNRISYREAIELAFYGATVIHPKTLQPLQRKEIPLFVRSFKQYAEPGTCVGAGVDLDPDVACFILKKDQVLLSLSSLDFSFMMEDNISQVFDLLHRYQMKVELIQNSAISFSVCVDNKYNTLEPLLNKLREKFKVTCYYGVTLYTIRHARPGDIEAMSREKEILLQQQSPDTVQLVVNE